jgi:hypothetical protein
MFVDVYIENVRDRSPFEVLVAKVDLYLFLFMRFR